MLRLLLLQELDYVVRFPSSFFFSYHFASSPLTVATKDGIVGIYRVYVDDISDIGHH